jgi:Protein of unknown function (DUF1549)/Protein of unknown function (DUF1553)
MPALLSKRSPCAALTIFLFAVSTTPGAEPEPLHCRIDRLIAATPDFAKNVAPLASDAEFLRRVYLDLSGSIPTSGEARAFLDDKAADKRVKLIDKLLASREFARHMANVWDVILMDRRRDLRVPKNDWHEFLRNSFASNKPYDQLVREILSADGADPKTRAAGKFLLDRDMDAYQATRDVSRLFLGRNIRCAQCHDHPNVPDYFQEHFYGIYAYFSRSFLFPDDKAASASIAEKGEGDVTFVSVFDKAKTTKATGPRLPGSKPVDEPKLEKGKEYTVAPAKGVKPVPAFSRRAQLATMLTAADNAAFRRTAANRFWAQMLGRGLIDPPDLDFSGNPPSHPELFDLLARELMDHKYDVKWFLRELALSETYQRSSEVPPQVKDVDRERYWVANVKALSPEQLAMAIWQASTADTRRFLGLKETMDAVMVAQFVHVFAGRPGEPEEDFEATLDQTLFLKNGPLIRDRLAPAGGLVGRLNALTDFNALTEELFLSVLTRFPTDEERKDVAEALKGATNRPAALGEIAWALLASAEFRFNH